MAHQHQWKLDGLSVGFDLTDIQVVWVCRCHAVVVSVHKFRKPSRTLKVKPATWTNTET